MPSLNTGNAILSNAIAVDSSYNVSINGSIAIGAASASTFKAYIVGDVFGSTGFYTRNTADTFLGSSNNGSGIIVNGTTLVTKIVSGGNTVATFASTGAATFSSSATEPFIINSSNATTLNTQYKYNNGTTLGYIGTGQGLINGGGSTIFAIRSENSMAFSVSGGNTAMSITSGGSVLVNATSSTYGAASGYNLGVKGTSGQAFISIARTGQNLDSQGIILGLDTAAAQLTMIDNLPLTFGTNNAERMRITSSGVVELNAADATYIRFSYLGTSKAFVGVAGASSDVISGAAAGDTVIRAQQKMLFSTGGDTERMRITSGGNVGIGITTPGAKLDVSGNAGAYACSLQGSTTSGQSYGLLVNGGSTSGDYALYVRNAALNTIFFQIRGDGLINLGTAAYSPYNYDTTGRTPILQSNGLFGYLSSTRESKTNIQQLSDISWLYKLNAVSFNYRKKDDEMKYTEDFINDKWYGLIADEVEGINKDLVFYNIQEDGTKQLAGVEYNKLISVLIKSVQELKAEIEELKAIVATK